MFTMRKTAIAARVALMVAAAGGMGSAMATNGYFPIGYGMKALGMGGASVASTDNGFAGANNPAAAAWSGTRIDAGANIFMPKRGYSRTEAFGAGGPLGGAQDSDSNAFLVPEFGYNRIVNNQVGVGLTVYGNGGMNTNYAGGNTGCATDLTDPLTGFIGNGLCGQGRLGVNLMQLVVAPTVAYKLNDTHSIGVSPLLVYQRFKATGLQGFGPFSSAGALPDAGYDSSHGVGVRLGYFGKLNDMTSVGVSYSPKINMSKFGKYAGLFADGGDFDIPANLTVGLSAQVTPKVRLALDYSSIKYSGVPSVANPSSNVMTVPGGGGALGLPSGSGFGWHDVNVIKVGVEWQQSANLTLRAGLNVGDNPIKGDDVTFNIIAPGVTTSHLTFGGTYGLSKQSELTFAYMYAPKKSVTGPSMFNGVIQQQLGAGAVPNPPFMETIQMSQQALGVQYSWKY